MNVISGGQRRQGIPRSLRVELSQDSRVPANLLPDEQMWPRTNQLDLRKTDRETITRGCHYRDLPLLSKYNVAGEPKVRPNCGEVAVVSGVARRSRSQRRVCSRTRFPRWRLDLPGSRPGAVRRQQSSKTKRHQEQVLVRLVKTNPWRVRRASLSINSKIASDAAKLNSDYVYAVCIDNISVSRSYSNFCGTF